MLYCGEQKCVTGGQKYEEMVWNIWKDMPEIDLERRWVGNPYGSLRRHTLWMHLAALWPRVRKYDLVVFNSAQGLFFNPLAWLLRLSGTPTAVFHHHYIYLGFEGWRRRYYRHWEERFLRNIDTLLIPSPYINHLCSEQFPAKRRYYWQIPFEAKSNASASSPVAGNLLYIGTIEPRKGLAYLVDAMGMLKHRGIDCRLTIIGKTVDEAYRAMLDKKIAAEGLDVRFTGFISEHEKDSIVSHSDIFTFPSLLEGYGMVICESLRQGLPVVCFDNSAMPYTIRDNVNGLLVADRDTEALADAIGRLITDCPLRDRLARGALTTSDELMTPQRFASTVRRDILQIVNADNRTADNQSR